MKKNIVKVTDVNSLWQMVMEKLKRKMSRKMFEIWMSEVSAKSFDADILVLSVPSEMHGKVLEKKYKTLIRRCVRSVSGFSPEIRFAADKHDNGKSTYIDRGTVSHAVEETSCSEPYIFVSYSHKDSEKVEEIIDFMIESDYRIWYDKKIKPGENWDDTIAERLAGSECVMCIISEAYLASGNCVDELNYAREKGKKILLVYIDEVELTSGMSMRLGRRQAIIAGKFDSKEDFYEAICLAPDIQGAKRYVDKSLTTEQMTFDNFTVTAENTEAYTLCRKLAENNAECRVAYIFGGAVWERIHLKNAVMNHIKKENSDIRIISYIVDEFTDDMINHLKNMKMTEFRRKLRSADVLIIDSCDSFAGKESTQNELFHLFLPLVQENKRILLLSQTSVFGINDVSNDLRSFIAANSSAEIN